MAYEMDPLLKELVQQQLASNGILSKLKAQLRAHVFLALEDNGEFKKQFSTQKAVSSYLSTGNGILAASLVRDFLQQLGLEFTLTVFDSEISGETSPNYISRNELSTRMGCENVANQPVLDQVIGSVTARSLSSVPVTPQNPLNSTYVKTNEPTPEQSIISESSQSVEEAVGDGNDGRCTPTNEGDNNKSVNLLMFTPVAPKKPAETELKNKESRSNTNKVTKEAKSSPLGDLPPLMTSNSHTSDIRRLLNEGLATLNNQNNAGVADDGPSLSCIESQSEPGISTADETASRLSDADVTDTISV